MYYEYTLEYITLRRYVARDWIYYKFNIQYFNFLLLQRFGGPQLPAPYGRFIAPDIAPEIGLLSLRFCLFLYHYHNHNHRHS